MNMIFLKFIIIFILCKSPKICESAETGREEPVDFRNPIDLSADRRQNQSPTKDNWSVDGGPTLVLFDDTRDELRRKEGVDDRTVTRQPKRVVFRDDTFDRRNRYNPYNPYYIDIERQREIDRRKHSGIIPDSISLNLGNLVNSRIKKEREDEIRREINKAIDRKEHFLEDIVFQKRMGWNSNRQRQPDQRNHLPNNAFANRVGTFDSALERTEMERRDRLSQIERERSRTTKRNIPRPHRGPIREEFRGQKEEVFSKRREEEKLKNIEDRRTSEILNEKRSGIIGVELMNRPYGHKLKPPILIYEEVPIPVKVHDDYRSKEYDTIEDYDGGSVYYMDRRPGRPSVEDESNDVTYVEEGIFVEDVPVSISSGSITHVDPTLETNIALANDFITAVELDKLNQAATIADINALQQLQLQQAATLATINEINQATLHKHIHDASILASASTAGEAANIAAASQAILNHQIADTASVDEELSKAQKVDFINLVLKHGLRQALKEQLKLHLHNKGEEEAFVHSLQVTRDDLIKRLLLLKPYFSSPTTGGFILPAFIPNIPVGHDYTSDELDHLPQIHLLPTTTLLDPNFRIPAEILGDLKNEIDITFVEFILRLPERVFLKVIHLPKRDFILTLFPTVYRETMTDYKYDPVKHYHPNLPHKGIVKEHHHHHHIHTPPSVEKVSTLEHPKPPFKGGYPKYVPLKEEHHIHHVTPPPSNYQPEPETVPFPDIPFDHVVSQLVPDSHKEVHIVRHPVHPGHPVHSGHPVHPEHPAKPSFVGHFDHPRLTIPHGGTSFEKPRFPFDSSYIAYQDDEQKFPEESISFHHGEPGFPPLISPHPVKGINVRFKGGKRPDIIYPTRLPTNNFDEYIEGRNGDSEIPNSKEKFGLQKVTKNKFENIIHLSEVDSKIQTSTSLPLELDEINPSTISPKRTAVIDDPDDTNGLGTTTPVPQISTFTNVPIAVTTISSLDALSINPALSTSNSVPDDKDKEDQAVNFNSDIESSFAETSTFSTPISTFSPVHKPFRGFSGNIRQVTFAERLKENTEGENNLNIIPGSDVNDDDHVLSFFQKKKGNVTDTLQENNNRIINNNFTQTNSAEEIVSKVKRITNIFGTRLQETIPEIHVKESNISSLHFNPFFPGRASDTDDIIKPSTQIDISSNDLRPLIHQNQIRTQIRSLAIDNQQETGSAISAAIPPQDSIKKRPMPRRIDFTKHTGFGSQEPHHFIRGSHENAAETSKQKGKDVPSNTGTFAGIQIHGLESLPHHLRTPPPCTVTPSVNRSFCIYPENYDSKIATHIVQRYGSAIDELKTILEQIPNPRPDLNEASKQLPHLNLSVTCDVEVRHVKLSWSRDVLGSWLSILQTEPFEQDTVVSTCSDNARTNGCRPLLQPRPFIAFHPSDVTPKPYIMEFPLPVGCVYAIS